MPRTKKVIAYLVWLSTIIISLIYSPPRGLYAANKLLQITDFSQIPLDTFIFMIFNVETKEVFLGYSKEFSQIDSTGHSTGLRNGGHATLLAKALNVEVEDLQATLPKVGEGEFIGGGFIKGSDGYTWIHRYSSNKAAGSTAEQPIGFVNGRVKNFNEAWPAIIPPDYAEDFYTAMAEATQQNLKLDNDVLNSKKFPFNYAKHPNPNHIDNLTKNATTWLNYKYSKARFNWFEISSLTKHNSLPKFMDFLTMTTGILGNYSNGVEVREPIISVFTDYLRECNLNPNCSVNNLERYIEFIAEVTSEEFNYSKFRNLEEQLSELLHESMKNLNSLEIHTWAERFRIQKALDGERYNAVLHQILSLEDDLLLIDIRDNLHKYADSSKEFFDWIRHAPFKDEKAKIQRQIIGNFRRNSIGAFSSSMSCQTSLIGVIN